MKLISSLCDRIVEHHIGGVRRIAEAKNMSVEDVLDVQQRTRDERRALEATLQAEYDACYEAREEALPRIPEARQHFAELGVMSPPPRDLVKHVGLPPNRGNVMWMVWQLKRLEHLH